MKSKLLALAVAFAALGEPVAAQNAFSEDAIKALAASPTKPDRSIEYHGGPVLTNPQDVYFVAYGCWGTTGCGSAPIQYNDLATLDILTRFVENLGGTPYFAINTTYTDLWGHPVSGGLLYAGTVVDNSYSHGSTLSEVDLQRIVAEKLESGALPQDPSGIYVVLTTGDITVEDGTTKFCQTCCNLHGTAYALGSLFRYVFVGNPSRCPGGCATRFDGKPSPNDNYAADAMASWLAHALNGVVTNGFDNAWYDRNGLENSEKCEGTYGTTYTVTNASGQLAEANIRLGPRHFLLQQNWLNGKKGHCTMDPSL